MQKLKKQSLPSTYLKKSKLNQDLNVRNSDLQNLHRPRMSNQCPLYMRLNKQIHRLPSYQLMILTL